MLLLFLGGLSLSSPRGSSSQSAWAQGRPAAELLPGTVTLAAEDLAAASGWGAALDDCVQVEDWILCPEEVSRLEALALCALLDASLAAPETEAVWKDLQAKVERLSERTFWLGFDDRREEGRWVREDGSPLDFTAWASGQPDDYQQSEDCAHMNWGEERLLNDVSCDAELGFVCKLKAPSAETGN